jgi:hypothetical protein
LELAAEGLGVGLEARGVNAGLSYISPIPLLYLPYTSPIPPLDLP